MSYLDRDENVHVGDQEYRRHMLDVLERICAALLRLNSGLEAERKERMERM